MSETRLGTNEPIDVRLLARQDLPHEAFPGGRNEGFRVFFTPEVHAAVWQHAALETSVEICGVLVGSWHRDEVGPFVKVSASIRGEGADTRFAEVTFTHETWAKINHEMDTRYSNLSIVGWYHTHPDFGIFLSDRDRFIQEHFFSGPGQVAHVIDPIRKIEGLFVWRDGKPALAKHYWIGDRILGGTAAGQQTGPHPPPEPRPGAARSGGPIAAAPAQEGTQDSVRRLGDWLPPSGRLFIYGGVFLLGYLLAKILTAWERQRFVENVLVSNGFVAVLRLDLSDELDRLRGDLAAILGKLESIGSQGQTSSESIAESRAKLAEAARRIGAIKARYGNTAAEDDLLRRFFRDKLTRILPREEPRVERERAPDAPIPAAPTSAGAKSGEIVSSAEANDSKTQDSRTKSAVAKP
jgi:proteasome lid subunit RPN8/RPN11